MFNWLTDIANLERNVTCGGVGALIVIIYQLYKLLPDIRAEMFYKKQRPEAQRGWLFCTFILAVKVVCSIIGAAAVTGLLIRPEETYGALLTGMTWTTVVKELIKGTS